MRGIDGTSWNNNRPPGVAFTLQVSQHLVETQGDVTSHVFSNDKNGSRLFNNSKHLRPEVTVIRRAPTLPTGTEGLARVATGDEADASVDASVKLADVSVDGYTTEAL